MRDKKSSVVSCYVEHITAIQQKRRETRGFNIFKWVFNSVMNEKSHCFMSNENVATAATRKKVAGNSVLMSDQFSFEM